MIPINEAFIQAAAPSAQAARSGRNLLSANKFFALHHSPDETLWFGQCRDTGNTVHSCSVDFTVADRPVYRCTCSGRSVPCRHSLGLLYAIAGGTTFTAAAVSGLSAPNGRKPVFHAARRRGQPHRPAMSGMSAMAKKIRAQLAGLDLLEQTVADVVRAGVDAADAARNQELEERAAQLGDACLPGARAAVCRLARLFAAGDGRELAAAQREALCDDALGQLCQMRGLVAKGRAYLHARLEDPELAPETDTGIAAWLGHAWQPRQLREAGLVEQNVELLQLAFNVQDAPQRREVVHTGAWMQLETGRIYLTEVARPARTLLGDARDDSFFQVARVPELRVYPGGFNPCVCWETMLPWPVEQKDLARVRNHGRDDFAAVIRKVTNHLKMPLADRFPICVLNYRRIGVIAGRWVIEDWSGQRLVMTDRGVAQEPASIPLLALLPASLLEEQTLIVRFCPDLGAGGLEVKPLGVVSQTELIRLTL
ncbi:MAG: SWIM zinc finger family protein [Thermoguttaceae bacterium]